MGTKPRFNGLLVAGARTDREVGGGAAEGRRGAGRVARVGAMAGGAGTGAGGSEGGRAGLEGAGVGAGGGWARGAVKEKARTAGAGVAAVCASGWELAEEDDWRRGEARA